MRAEGAAATLAARGTSRALSSGAHPVGASDYYYTTVVRRRASRRSTLDDRGRWLLALARLGRGRRAADRRLGLQRALEGGHVLLELLDTSDVVVVLRVDTPVVVVLCCCCVVLLLSLIRAM